MKPLFRHSTFLFSMCFLTFTASAQYVINGTAQQLSCNCYRLTEAINTQGGSVWNSNMISLTDPFDFTFDVYLGNQPSGADGIAFVLQPVSTAEGSTGGGIGYAGIVPSVAIEVDTYQNGWDPVEDHMAIQANGDNDHTTSNNLAGPTGALASGGDIEDGQTHLMRVTWDPTTFTLTGYMDGSLRVSYVGDVVSNFLFNDPMVFWGFTGSTGGLNNRQEFCLSIIPGLSASENEICAGQEVFFDDDSYSALGNVVSWYWNFDNGSVSSLETPGAVQFAEAGTYTVVQTIVDAAGCDATDSLDIVVHPNPSADFTGSEVCQGEETDFQSTSTVPSGSLVDWDWEFGDGDSDSGNNVSHTFQSAGSYDVWLHVTSNFGCTDSALAVANVLENPVADPSHEGNSLSVTFNTTLLNGEEAQWIILDTIHSGAVPFQYSFPDSGWYDVALLVTNANGCMDSVWFSIYVEGIPEYQIPNVFTPNGDDFNEMFQPFTYGITDANMKIFNRWGRPVYKYEGQVPLTDPWGWDGNVNGGAKAADGTYYYVLDLKAINGENFSEKGTVTLLR